MNKAEKTRQFIIEKTAPIFNRKGFAGTSLFDITEATGLTKGSIYGNFENKDAVALEVFKYNVAKMQAKFDAQIHSEPTAKGKLLAYAAFYEKNAVQLFPDGGCPILNTAIEADDTHQELKNAAVTSLMFWKKNLEQIIFSGIQHQEFKASTNPEEAALAILAIIEGAMMISKLTGKLNYMNSLMGTLRYYIYSL